MAITLASDAISDAEITDAIGLGDLEAAARLWVRHWPTALEAARLYVSPDEVPGLAAEALIATVSAIAIGRGPREDVHGFVVEAVRELGEDDEPPVGGPEHPPVFVSPMMSSSFAQLDPELQDTLRTAVAVGQLDEEGVRALTVLQHYYLAEHTDRAETPACRRAHIAMMSVADSSATEGVPRKTWLHMSTCAWCTEAFHEVAFSNIALGALIEPAVLNPPVVAVGAPLESFETVAAPFELEDGAAAEEPTDFVEPVYLAPEEPLLFDAQPVPEEEDEDEAAAVVAAAHVGSRRGRLIAIGIAAAAAVSVVGVILVGQGDDTTAPTAAGTDTTTQAAPSGDATPSDDVEDPATESPSGFTTVDAPLAPTKAATSKATTASTPTKAATKPASTPTRSNPSTPTPTSQPTTSEPTPTPTPTATPTKPCNRLQHLLHIC
ncbi:hypothetical protein [Nocardioides marmorisolisilvae]|uniref:Uncharacterized protein n=1 Tax=Nocardioides marmorisolisilvae TaxID=1542737 RepID=A0A3N0E0Q4_9ACTN|nr:hypothetical protein [Nocardioides marmorisolisilvae]RNL81428.1 hypothetical protein EFL95_03600 [Nocardioides marmorisolisilvae]